MRGWRMRAGSIGSVTNVSETICLSLGIYSGEPVKITNAEATSPLPGRRMSSGRAVLADQERGFYRCGKRFDRPRGKWWTGA